MQLLRLSLQSELRFLLAPTGKMMLKSCRERELVNKWTREKAEAEKAGAKENAQEQEPGSLKPSPFYGPWEANMAARPQARSGRRKHERQGVEGQS